MSRAELLQIEKPLSEAELIERIKRGELFLPPVQLRLLEIEPMTYGNSRVGDSIEVPDGILEVIWKDKSSRFVFECKSHNTPMALQAAVAQALRYSKRTGLPPMIIVPFLAEVSLQMLEGEGVSGIDLSGNGIITAPDLAVWRSGQPNRFKDSQPIRNIFRGNSSILARCFLLRSEFSSLVELRVFALERLMKQEIVNESRLTKGTVSKVIQVLGEENIIMRGKSFVRLTDPQTLLERLRINYQKPQGRRVEGKMSLTVSEAWSRLSKSSLRYIATGDGSAGSYHLLSSSEKLSLYVDDLEGASSLLSVKPGRVFPNVELIEEKSDLFYFDARPAGAIRWASPIQTWLELSLAGPREREAAKMLEAALLEGLRKGDPIHL